MTGTGPRAKGEWGHQELGIQMVSLPVCPQFPPPLHQLLCLELHLGEIGRVVLIPLACSLPGLSPKILSVQPKVAPAGTPNPAAPIGLGPGSLGRPPAPSRGELWPCLDPNESDPAEASCCSVLIKPAWGGPGRLPNPLVLHVLCCNL